MANGHEVCWVNPLLTPDLQASIGAEVQEHVETAVKGIGLKRGLIIIKTMIKGGTRYVSITSSPSPPDSVPRQPWVVVTRC